MKAKTVRIDLLQLSQRELLDLYHACASALQRGGAMRTTNNGSVVREQLLVPVQAAALVTDPPRSR